MNKGKLIASLGLAFMPYLGYSQVKPTIDLKLEESLLILIKSHAKIVNINEVHTHVRRLVSIMEENKEIVNRIGTRFNLRNERIPTSTVFEHVKDYCLGIKTTYSVGIYNKLQSLPKDDPDFILIEQLRQAVIKSAELFKLTPEEYVISGKF
jgi:hypothetical protein